MEPGNSSRRRRPGGRRGQASPRPVAQDRDLPGSAGDGPSNEPSRERSLRGRSRHRNRNRRPVVSPPPPTPTAPFIRVLIDDDPGTGAGGTLPPPDESERPWPFETIGRYTGARGYGSRPCVRETSLYAERRRQSALARLVERTDGGELDGDSSAAPPSDYTGAEGAGIRPRVRQSALYSDRPRRPRHRGPAQTEEQPSEISSSDLGRAVTDLPTFEERSDAEHRRRSPSARLVERSDGSELDGDSSPAPPSDHPGAEGAVTGTRFRQSILYSNRRRKPQSRRVSARTEEHLSEVNSHERGTDLPTFEAPSSSEPALLIPEISEEIDEDDMPDSEQRPLYSMPLSLAPESVIESCSLLYTTVSFEDLCQRRPRPHANTEELLREMKEYMDALPEYSLGEAFDRIKANEHATLTALAAKWGVDPPPDPFLFDWEAPSPQEAQHASAAAANPQQRTAPRKPRHEASREEIVQNGKKWMKEEVMLCFKKHVERTAYLAGLDEYDLDELRHQCFNEGNYNNVFHHYNFTIKMKMAGSDDWTVELYFAEVKELFGRKQYFCCPLEPDENGHCYACKSHGMDDLKHPATGGFDAGSADVLGGGLWYPSEEEDSQENEFLRRPGFDAEMADVYRYGLFR